GCSARRATGSGSTRRRSPNRRPLGLQTPDHPAVVSEAIYNLVVTLGRLPFWVSSKPLILDVHHARRDGAYLLASSHLSPYDVPVLYRHTPRHIDFVSIIEIMRKPGIGWLFR